YALTQEIKDKILLKTWKDLKLYCLSQLSHKKHEEFHVLYMDTKGALIKDETISSGTIDYATIYPRNLVKEALECNAKSIILVHNHPSGDLVPSANDLKITKEIQNMLTPIGITLIDHIIVGKNEIQTFKDLGVW
ncbi:MAG: DNA repair protein RadC, partial [Rickettsiales bacterium]|nr:DNA repair protein RadC [Rickettsiales bacterium]